MKTVSALGARLVRLFAAMILASLALGMPAHQVHAADNIVTNENDDGPGSLRQVIADADKGTTIAFDNDYTIILESPLTIDKDLTIDGEGRKIGIVGGKYTGVNGGTFIITEETSVTLNHLVISGGSAERGGGVYVAGVLNVNNSIVTGNTAFYGGGIFNHGTTTLNASTVSANNATTDGAGLYNDPGSTLHIENGSVIGGDGAGNKATGGASAGGIFNYSATLTIDSSTVSHNFSAQGSGGIINYGGTATITNSTIASNVATVNAGAIFNNNSLTIANTIIYENHAGQDGGGIYNDSSGTLTIVNSTFSENEATRNGGGLYNHSGGATLVNTIVASSVAGGNCYGAFTDGGNNLVWGDESCPGTNADPILSALGDYGGPTQTLALLPGSAAIDTGNDDTCAASPISDLDQRGVSRPQGSHCDTGAFESRGFELAVSSGSGQSAELNAAFTDPLVVGVSSTHGEPVDGGIVTFTPPASGTSADITGSPATISFGAASVTATANDVVGSYSVNAGMSGAASEASFSLQNTCADSIEVANSNDDGPGSLRRAITSICSGGTITFAGDTTIYLASQLVIDHDMTINGSGHNVTTSGDTNNDGSRNVRSFYVYSGVDLHLSHLTIRDGNDLTGGGGIYNNGGTLTVSDCTISNNSNEGEDSHGSGGGIYHRSGDLTVSSSTFSGNAGRVNGGGIFVYSGNANVINSTFSGNSSRASGGGIDMVDGTLTVSNSTFSGNGATLHGGGIFNVAGSATIQNTIVANSTAGENCAGTISDGGGNLVWGDSTCPGINADPKLSVLGNYGGSTQTFALLPGSAAIGGGVDTICTASPVNSFDQRGVVRPQAVHCDIGAFESHGFELTVSSGSGQSAAINTAFTNPLVVGISSTFGEPVNGGTVTFTPPASGASATITGSPATISSGAASATATANDAIGSYDITANTEGAYSGANFTLQNDCASAITVTNSNDDGPGSLRRAISSICFAGTITFAGDTTIYLASQLTIDHNMTIDGAGHTVVISGDSGHDGTYDVLPLYVGSSVNLNLNHLTVTHGRSFSDGGGIVVHGTLTISECIITDNRAYYGAGIYNYGSLVISNSTFSVNRAAVSGGGIYNGASGTLKVSNSTFSENTAPFSDGPSYGGGIVNDQGNLTITNSTFSANGAYSDGGAIANFDGVLNITNSTFSGNYTTEGSNITNQGSGTVNLRNTLVTNSTSGGLCSGTIINKGGNLVWGDTTCPGINADPKLGTLANNGGPTKTFAPLSGSAAMDAGNDTICAASVGAPNYGAGGLDQRGVTRLQGSHCDIGAFERVNQLPVITEGASTPVTMSEDGSPTAFALTLHATDGNDDPITWSISSQAGHGTATASGTGASKAIGYSPNANYNGSDSFVVQTRDGYGGTDTITVNVTIDPVNDAPTNITLSNSKVNENRRSGATVGTLSTTDPDPNDTFTYSLSSGAACSGTNNSSFQISGKYLKTKAIFNYESKKKYIICIQTRDSQGSTRTKQFTITVNDLPETFTSTGSYDGWVLESSETSSKGGSLNATATTFYIGDDASDRQYRAILSFDTSGLPNNATITKITLKIKRQGSVGTNPFSTHGGLYVDIKKGSFSSTSLQIGDFQASPSLSSAGTFSKTLLSGNWYQAVLKSSAKSYVNLTGVTQFRLRFYKDDNDDRGADYLKFYSGNYSTASYRPVLLIEYTTP